MLRIEKGGDEQIRDEIQAYAPLIPKTFPDGSKELVATMMIEIEDIPLRHKMLTLLQGIEKHIILRFGPFSIAATWEKDVERTRDGKTSSVHFMKFFLKDQESKTFDEKNMDVILEITHPHYTHKTVLSDLTRHNLASK
jgi:CO dehydrogenase/acetyl-CoA synthase epsilon subunit